MLKRRQIRARGFSLIELLVAVTVLGLVLMLGLPNLSAWLQNTHIRNSAEAMMTGLQLARAEALRRNRPVRFSLVDSLDATCSVTETGRNWVISMADPAAKCHEEASETADPFIVQKRSSEEGSQNAFVTAAPASITFNGLGSKGPGTMLINVSNPSGGACRTPAGSEPMRCLQVVVNSNGSARMCDPAVTEITDPRAC